MATTIRLTRMGKKKRPFYRLVVLDSRKRRDGAYLANLGFYNPFVEPPEIKLHADDIVAWLGKGATLSPTARALLKREGILYRFSLVKQGLDEAKIAALLEEWRAGAGQRVARKEDDRQRRMRHIADAEQKRRDDAAKAAQESAAAAAAPADEDTTGTEAETAETDEAEAEAAPEAGPDDQAADRAAGGEDGKS